MRDTETALELYKSKLPPKPYHTNNYIFGKQVGSLKSALKSTYLQPNSLTHKYFIILDLDSDTSVLDWTDKGLPPPHLIVRNLDNGRSHMTYILKTSVKIDVSGRLKPLKYCSDVEHGLAVRIGADMNYNGLLTKNPFNTSAFKVFSFQDEPYDLDYLNEFVDKDLVRQQREAKKKKNVEDGFASGRNCTLFETLRLWAYSNWHRFHQAELHAEILDQAMMFNTFECPLGMNEVRTIADSVYRFITQHFSIERLNELKSERAKQSRKKSSANLIYVDGKPWEDEGIPKRTYYYRKTNGVNTERQIISKAKPWKKLGIGRTKWYELGKPDKI
ncbi:MAG: replication initiation protein [Pseudomonas sp.]|uniref:replication initiation protein n=1 Tax=Pseudomonas sp. TaxID=306 RepID=UPI003D12BCCF